MQKYNQFIFEAYRFDPVSGLLELNYSLDGKLRFLETYRFDFDYVDYDKAVLDRAIQSLFFMAGVSYFKTFIPPEIIVKSGELDQTSAAFFGKAYQHGLGEFWFVNGLDPHTPVTFPAAVDKSLPVSSQEDLQGMLVAVGGGKDSLVTIEMLRDHSDITTWSLGHRPQLTPLVEKIGLPHAWVERTWDRQLLELNSQGTLNGHIPISGIFACVGVIVALLTGKRDVVMSNEQSANDPTLHYQGVAINHQYSKSQEYEKDFQDFLRHIFGSQVRYYSFLRPLSEVRISEIFARIGFEKYKSTFSSCNRAFVHSSDHMSWCGECPKCAFVFMALTPFVSRDQLEELWGGKNLLLDPGLETTYRKLLGIEGDKPLDCVGDVKESREAMHLAFQTYPELAKKYQFELPTDYDYRSLGGNEMPENVYKQFTAILEKVV